MPGSLERVMTLATRPSESVLEVTTLIAPLPAVMVNVTVILLNGLPFSSRISTTNGSANTAPATPS